MRTVLRCGVCAAVVGAAWLASARPAEAQVSVRRTFPQPSYALEVEPHLVLGPASPPGPGTGSGGGAGVRGTLPVWNDGLFEGVRDSVAVGLGLDLVRYRGLGGVAFGRCVETRPGPAGTTICTRVDTPGGPASYAFLPVVLQWNVWLTPELSLMAEPGLVIYLADGGAGAGPSIHVGGRYRITDAVCLTLRVGWPTITAGASIFF